MGQTCLLLFTLAVDDVSLVLKYSKVLIYADDTKIFSTIKTEYEALLLQDDLNRFAQWCAKSNLKLNADKCEFMRLYRMTHPVIFHYNINNLNIKRCQSVTDLGVIFDQKIRFHLHVNHVASRASSTLGFVKRWSKEFNSPTITRHLYISLVRPILEYACQVWTPPL